MAALGVARSRRRGRRLGASRRYFDGLGSRQRRVGSGVGARVEPFDGAAAPTSGWCSASLPRLVRLVRARSAGVLGSPVPRRRAPRRGSSATRLLDDSAASATGSVVVGRTRDLAGADDRDLAGQLGDGDGIAVAAPAAPATADRRRADGSVLRQQLGDRDRPAWVSRLSVIVCLVASADSAQLRRGLHQGGSIGLTVESPQDDALAQRPRADVHRIPTTVLAYSPPPPGRPPRSVAPARH